MNKDGYKQFEMQQNNMQVILEFPEKAINKERIENDVTIILSNILQEYLAKIWRY